MAKNWISVNDEMPEKYNDVLVYSKDGYFVGWWGGKTWSANKDFVDSMEHIDSDVNQESVTHWMKLPLFPND